MQPGFQMSFAATIALVAVFEALRGRTWWQATQTAPSWRFAKPIVGIAMTSLVAGAATAPISAFHFNTVAQYGLIANLLAIPAMGVVVMPAAVVAVLAAPLRARLAAVPDRRARAWATSSPSPRFVAGLGGAVTGVPAGPPASLGADPDRRDHGRALDRAGALGGAGAGGARAAALGRARPAGRDHRRQRAALRHPDAGGAGALERPGQRLCRRELAARTTATSRPRPRPWARGRLERRKHRIEAEVPGLGQLVYVGQQGRGAARPRTAPRRRS